jgi:hypothetical protein
MSGTVAEAFSMPMREAVEYLAQKVRTPTRRWTDIAGPGHTRAFAVAGVQADDMLAGIKGELEKALREGTTLAEFRRGLEPMMERLGWRAKGKAYEAWRTRLVYQANLNTAYAAGRYAQMTEPDTLEALPFWVYRHSRKKDARKQHVAWDGKVLAADDPWWRTHYPPNGWGCGCWADAISRRELRQLGKDGPDEAPKDGTRSWRDPASGEVRQVPNGIDPGWDHNHGEGWLNGVVPRELREDLPPAGPPRVPAQGLPPMPQVRPVDPARRLPDGLTDEAYADAFLEEFGATRERPAVFRDVTGTRVVIGAELFGASGAKANKNRRGPWMRLLADALRDPDEVWADWALVNGQPVLRRRYLRRHGLPGLSNALTVLSWTAKGWLGTTSYPPGARQVEKERHGVLLYRRREEEE